MSVLNPDPISSSGDLLADRRYGFGAALVAEGDHAAAADLFAQTVERAPLWAPAWLALGLAQEAAGRPEAALAALRRAVALDKAGLLGATLHLARLENAGASAVMPQAFVRRLFDQYAERFDTHLVHTLAYRGPLVIAEALGQARCGRVREAIDLGCGTGLMAREIAGLAEAIDGVDLSPAMVEQARRTGLYRRLTIGEVSAVLADCDPGSFDLATAADVMVYLGALEDLVGATTRVLRPGGFFAFTLQRLVEGEAYRLGPDMRFSHTRAYIEAVLTDAGLDIRVAEEVSTREDRGVPVPGLVLVAHKP